MIALLWLFGCISTEEEFRREADETLCEWSVECFSVEDEATCLETAEASWDGAIDTACVFDRGQARRCIAGMRQMACPEPGRDPAFPSACDEVWDCS